MRRQNVITQPSKKQVKSEIAHVLECHGCGYTLDPDWPESKPCPKCHSYARKLIAVQLWVDAPEPEPITPVVRARGKIV